MKSAEEILSESSGWTIEELRESVINDDFVNNMVISAEEVIEAMEAYAEQFKPKWISVTERLPENEGVQYLVRVRNKNKQDGIYLHDVAYFEEGIFKKRNTWENVTHWRCIE